MIPKFVIRILLLICAQRVVSVKIPFSIVVVANWARWGKEERWKTICFWNQRQNRSFFATAARPSPLGVYNLDIFNVSRFPTLWYAPFKMILHCVIDTNVCPMKCVCKRNPSNEPELANVAHSEIVANQTKCFSLASIWTVWVFSVAAGITPRWFRRPGQSYGSCEHCRFFCHHQNWTMYRDFSSKAIHWRNINTSRIVWEHHLRPN